MEEVRPNVGVTSRSRVAASMGRKVEYRGNRSLDRASHNVAQTFRFAYMWYKKNVAATISGSQTDKFPVAGRSLETAPTGERGNRGCKPLLQGEGESGLESPHWCPVKAKNG